MKALVISFFFVAATSASAATYECTENASDAFRGDRLQYAVAVVTSQQTAKVSLFKRDPREGRQPFRPMIPTFVTPIKIENGILHIDAVVKHRLYFLLNLSAPKLATLQLQWVRGDIELHCK